MPLRSLTLRLTLLAIALAAPASAQHARTEGRSAAELAHLRTLTAGLDLPATPTAAARTRPAARARVAPVGGATLTVTTAADAGPGSLREAIEAANATPETDTIAFSIDGGGSYQEIFLASTLPLVSAPIYMDGDSQGCDTAEGQCIRLDGGALSDDPDAFDYGLALTGGDSQIYGIVFTRFFAADGISALGVYSSNNTVQDCYFGTDRAGATTDPDGTPGTGDELGNGFGIAVASYEGLPVARLNTIGSTEAGLGVVVAGSTLSGVGLLGAETTLNFVAGVYAGTNPAGAAGLGNGESGLLLSSAASGNFITDNVLSGNAWDGLTLQQGASDNVVAGNRVGTDPTGTAALPNGTLAGLAQLKGTGITVLGGSGNNIFENVVSGNLLAGIALGSGNGEGEAEPAPIAGNSVTANLVGTDATGLLPLPNGVPGVPDVGFGVVFFAGPNVSVTGNEVGGDGDPELANVIAFNTTAGVGGEGPGVTGNVVDGNLIGVTADGEAAANGLAGVLLRNGPSGNRIGGVALDPSADFAGNLIANHPAGVALLAFTGGNEVAFNTFSGGVGAYLPVDLGGDGPTANDAGDGDEGPNRLLNAPEILAAPIADGQVTARYRVDADAAAAAYPLTVRFYAQVPDGGALLHVPLGSATSDAPGEGAATFPTPFGPGTPIVATATDAAGHTSEATLAGIPVAQDAAPSGLDQARVAPNPTAGPVRLAFALAAPAEVSAAVFDVLGREVLATPPARLGAGPQALALDAALPAGVYVWRLRAGDRVETGRLTVAR